jgi:hypothetical protein
MCSIHDLSCSIPLLITSSLGLAVGGEIDDRDRELWNKAVVPYLQRDFRTEANAYNGGHFLMVPLHAAFQKGAKAWQDDLGAQFKRITAQGTKAIAKTTLSRLQYLYLCSRFMTLANETQRADLIPPQLDAMLIEELESVWTTEPNLHWNGTKFKGRRECVLAKLQAQLIGKSYYRAILDTELHLMAIAAELRHCELITRRKHRNTALITEVLSVARQVFIERAVPERDGRWRFQPGVWADHPDFAYAGNKEKAIGLLPRKVSDIAEDTGHSARIPMWLTSFAQAYPAKSAERRYYEALKRGFEKQFYEQVLVPPGPEMPAYRTANFLDGRNGVYRWGYGAFAGKNEGYGPYETSGVLTLGWYSFLDSERMREVYRQMATQFPLPKQVETLYLGPGTTPGSHLGEIRELIVRLAAKLDPQ